MHFINCGSTNVIYRHFFFYRHFTKIDAINIVIETDFTITVVMQYSPDEKGKGRI